MSAELRIDEVGYWSEVKLSILEEYAKRYNQILRASKMHPIYIDGFAGAGYHLAKDSTRVIEGSPSRALNVDPPFEYLHFVDIDGARATELTRLAGGRRDVMVHCGDCNEILTDRILPSVSYARFERALCILDPYGLHLNWETIRMAGQSKVVEIFLNFPVMDMNMNVLWHNSDRVSEVQRQRMARFWGDDSWEKAAYQNTPGLFGPIREKRPNETIAEAFRNRLKSAGGFEHVPKPMPMRNTKGAIVYYLFFAAQKPVASKIVKYIFARYANYGEAPNG